MVEKSQKELVNDTYFTTIEQAQLEILKYIETNYNPKRLHSTLGHQSSLEFEKRITSSLNFMSAFS